MHFLHQLDGLLLVIPRSFLLGLPELRPNMYSGATLEVLANIGLSA